MSDRPEETRLQGIAYADLQRDRRRYAVAKPLWTVVSVGLALVFTLLSVRQAAKLTQLTAQVNSRHTELNKVNAEMAAAQKELEKVNREKEAVISVVNSYNGAGPKRARSATILYFPRDADGQRVEAALKDLGFQFDLHRTQQQMASQATNAIFCGSQVTPDELRLVALALINGGVKLQAIHGASKWPKIIQIGHSSSADRAPLITAEAVADGTAFNSHGYICKLPASS